MLAGPGLRNSENKKEISFDFLRMLQGRQKGNMRINLLLFIF
jgi:hypothetical protein